MRHIIGDRGARACVAWLAAHAFAADEPEAPRLFLSDGAALAQVKERIAAGDKRFKATRSHPWWKADKDLRRKPLTIVNKPKAPSAIDKHDYVSLAPYWWPDPDKPDGLPYIHKDGQTNPEHNQYDRPLLGKWPAPFAICAWPII